MNFVITAPQITGTWTPVIPRATITNASGSYTKTENLVVLQGQFTISASETGNAYILEDCIPEKGEAARIIIGQWESDDVCGTLANYINNNNVWFYYVGQRIPLTNQVGRTITFQLVFLKL